MNGQLPNTWAQQQVIGVSQPLAQSPNVQLDPQVADALKKIAVGIGKAGGGGFGVGGQVDKQSPEYKQAMMQQLAATGPLGAAASVLHQWGDHKQKKQQQQMQDMNAWMPTVTPAPGV